MTNTDIAVQKNETFCFDSNQVRVLVDQDETVWFVAKDVAEALGYGDTNQAIRKHCKCAKLLKGVESTGLVVPSRGLQIINRRDVFRLIMKSHLPEAEQFEEWVWDVIESVLDHGGYIKGQEQEDNPEMLMAKALKVADSVLKEKDKKIEAQRKQLEENLPTDGYRGFYLREYLTHGQKTAFGKRATKIANQNGIVPIQEEREVLTRGGWRDTYVNLYPKWVLDQAAEELGLK